MSLSIISKYVPVVGKYISGETYVKVNANGKVSGHVKRD